MNAALTSRTYDGSIFVISELAGPEHQFLLFRADEGPAGIFPAPTCTKPVTRDNAGSYCKYAGRWFFEPTL